MRGNLSVRINDGFSDKMVTGKTTGLRFRKTAPGGHHSASCTISVPRNTFRDLGPADKLYIYDSRTAATVWEGYTENPGATDGPAGQRYDLQASGGMILAQDQSTPVVFLERSLDDSLWVRIDNASSTKGATDQVVNTVERLLQFPSGTPVPNGGRVGHQYQGLIRTGQRVLVMETNMIAGKTDAGYTYNLEMMTGIVDNGGVYHGTATSATFSTAAGQIMSATAGVSPNFPIGANGPFCRIFRTGATTNVADDLTWGKFQAPYIRPILARADGTDETASYTPSIVKAHEIVNHVLGTMLPMFDGAGARVDPSTYQITQSTYHDGATPQKILDDLSLFEPDYLWEVLETNASGKHRFAYRAWPTTPRYEISVKDGYNAPGGEVDLCNRIIVYYTDINGVRQSVVVTQTVPELGSRVRDADSVTLPDGLGSAANAQRIGAMVLAQKTADAPKAATAVVRRPIVDNLRGCMVMPWEIEPGYLVRVRETGEDLRMTEMEYTDSDCSATLTLGTPVLSVEQILARLG